MFDISSIYLASSALDASRALARDPNAVLISGGSDVLIQIRSGKLEGCSLVSINGLPELSKIRLIGGDIYIGAAVTFAELEENPLIREKIPLLAQAAGQVGGPQIRAVGTIGGNVCNGVTSADTATSLLVLNATLLLQSERGVREVALSDFYTGVQKTCRAHDEVLTEIVIRRSSYEQTVGHYIKYAQRNAMDIATLGCAALLSLNHDKTEISSLSIAYGVAAPTPVLCKATAQFAKDRPISAESIDQIAQLAVSELNPRTSWRASREFRLQIAYELAKRVITSSIQQGGGVTGA